MKLNRTKKASHLLDKYLEFMAIEVFDKYHSLIKQYIKGQPGIYALYKDNKLAYVGLASDMMNRLKTHRKDKHAEKWDRFSIYLTKDDEHLKELETLLLRISAPERNVQSGKLRSAVNIEKTLRHDISEFQKKEREYLFKGEELDSDEIAVEVVSGGRIPTMGKYLEKVKCPFNIYLTYKGKTTKAKVMKDGEIRLGGKKFTSPSYAAVAASKSGHSMDGWHWWKYKNRKGELIALDKLRK